MNIFLGLGDISKTYYCPFRTDSFFWSIAFPGGDSGTEPACQNRRLKRCGFDPWVRKIPLRRKWHATAVFSPVKSHGQRSLVGYNPWGCKELDMAGVT